MPTEAEQQLSIIRAAYNSGVLRCRFGDTEITYKSEAEMRKIIAKLEAELGRSKPMQAITPRFSKGLD